MVPTKMVTCFGYKMAKDGRLRRKHLNKSVWVMESPVWMARKRCSKMAALMGILLRPQVGGISLSAVMKTVGPTSTRYTVQDTVPARDLRVKERQLRNSKSWGSPKFTPGYCRTEFTVLTKQKRHHLWGSQLSPKLSLKVVSLKASVQRTLTSVRN